VCASLSHVTRVLLAHCELPSSTAKVRTAGEPRAATARRPVPRADDKPRLSPRGVPRVRARCAAVAPEDGLLAWEHESSNGPARAHAHTIRGAVRARAVVSDGGVAVGVEA